jgi:uncharacterized protein
MHSSLYEGTIRHRRFAVRSHEFRHRIAMAYVDLDELPGLLDGRLVRARPGLVRFRRSDYLGDPAQPLDEAVRALVASRCGSRPAGPIRVLTHLRTFGHCFNPVSFYYCFEEGGERVHSVLAEVTSTPWGERRRYEFAGRAGRADKDMHVSPFLGMDHQYVFHATAPGEHLTVHIENRHEGERVFDATLSLERRPAGDLRRLRLRYPAQPLRVLALIYGHALLLALRGARYHPHPART